MSKEQNRLERPMKWWVVAIGVVIVAGVALWIGQVRYFSQW